MLGREVEEEAGDAKDWPRSIFSPVASFAKYICIIASKLESDDLMYNNGRYLC